jgi:hypothetical protein
MLGDAEIEAEEYLAIDLLPHESLGA